MNIMDTVNRLKARLLQVYKIYGQLTHPEVLKASQELDQALNELELQKRFDSSLKSDFYTLFFIR